MLTLDVAISTYGPDGIARVAAMDVPRLDGVRYVVSWQASGDTALPAALVRGDMTVVKTPTVGSSNNRNNVIAHCTADIILIADDDLRYTPERLQRVTEAFERHPEVDLATFRYDGDDNKRYLEGEHDLTRMPRNFWVACFEIAIRRATVVQRVAFDPRFGIRGTFASCAEEDVYLLQARRAGLCCRYFPVTITTHSGKTTGLRAITDRGVLLGSGATIRYLFPVTGVLRIVLKAWRLWRADQCGFWCGLSGLCEGWLRAPKLINKT